MARTDITTTKLQAGVATYGLPGDIAEIAGTAVDPTNGHRILFTKGRKVVLRITNTSAGTKTVTFKRPAASQDAVQGDYTSTPIAATTGVRMFGPIPGSFMQSDGTFWIDLQAAITGVIMAYELP